MLDARSAIVASTVYNMLRAEEAPLLTAADFMPRQKPQLPRRQQTAEEQLAIIKRLHRAFGGDMKDFERKRMN